MLQQELLADADGFRRDLDQFVIVDELKRELQRDADRRHEHDGFVGARGPHIGQLLALERVDQHVVVARIDADHHAFIDLGAVADEELAALLDVPEGEGERLAAGHGDDGALLTLADITFAARAVMVEAVEHQAGALGQGQEFGAEADQAACRDDVFQAHASLAVRDHVLHLGAARTDALHHRALVVFLDIDGQRLEGLVNLAVDLLQDDLGAADRQLEALAAHRLDQNGEVEFAAAGDAELVRIVQLLDAQGDVGDQLAVKTLLDLARGDVLAFTPGKRRIVDLEGHRDGRLVHDQRGQAFEMVGMADRVGNVERIDAGEHDDVPGAGLIGLHALKAVEAEHLEHLALAALAVGADDADQLVLRQGAAADASEADHAGIAGIIERADLKLERSVRIHVGRGDPVDDGLEERIHVLGRGFRVERRPALKRRGEDDREIHLLVGRAEAVEQVESLVHDPVGARAGAVDLVDDHDRLQTERERFFRHESGLRHRAVDRVDQQQHRIDHGQHALDFAAKVGVAGRVDDVDAVVLPLHSRVLGQDGNAAFAFQVIGIHDAFDVFAAVSERAGLAQQLVDEGGLAVVDVRDDGDITQIFDRAGHGGLSLTGECLRALIQAVGRDG